MLNGGSNEFESKNNKTKTRIIRIYDLSNKKFTYKLDYLIFSSL